MTNQNIFEYLNYLKFVAISYMFWLENGKYRKWRISSMYANQMW